MGEDTPVARKPRADQARNRDRLLTAARVGKWRYSVAMPRPATATAC